uniref:Uncharacterized protein n=1 Tax=Solanum lycopersicum TaxID=4081 RepID=A0A3Q7IW85_SOLLC
MLCKEMFDQVKLAFQKGIADHTVTTQQFEYAHSPFQIYLRNAINTTSSITPTLSGEFVDSQRQLLALALFGENSQSTNPLNHMNNGSLLNENIETLPNPTTEMS